MVNVYLPNRLTCCVRVRGDNQMLKASCLSTLFDLGNGQGFGRWT